MKNHRLPLDYGWKKALLIYLDRLIQFVVVSLAIVAVLAMAFIAALIMRGVLQGY